MTRSLFLFALLALIVLASAAPADMQVVDRMGRCPNQCRLGTGARFNARRECGVLPGCRPRRCRRRSMSGMRRMKKGWSCSRKPRPVVIPTTPEPSPEPMQEATA